MKNVFVPIDMNNNFYDWFFSLFDSGLLMLIALIVYISIFKAEVGGKLRPRSTLQPPLFTFRYGPGFLLYVFGFICAEMAGTLYSFYIFLI